MREKKNTKVFEGYLYEDYKKRYGQYKDLIRYPLLEVVEFEKKNNPGPLPENYEDYLLLQNRYWWLITDNFFEVPKKGEKIKKVHTRIKQSAAMHSVLLGLVAPSTVVVPSLLFMTSCSSNIQVNLDDACKDIAEIKDIHNDSDGNLLFSLTSKKENQDIDSFDIKVGDSNLIKDTDYTYSYDSHIVTIKKATLESHPGNFLVHNVSICIPVASVTLNKKSLDFILNNGSSHTQNLVATVLPENATTKTVTWKSSDTNVATVDNNGKVTAIKNGNCKITVTSVSGEKTASCDVTVKTEVEGIDIEGDKVRNLIIDEKDEGKKVTTLKAVITPSDATDKSISWSLVNEDDKQYVEIEPSSTDMTCKVTAKADTLPNGVQVQVKTNDGNFTSLATIHVTSHVYVKEIKVNESSITLVTNDDSTRTKKIEYNVLPENASDKSVKFTSHDKNVATVDETGLVTAISNGETTIDISAQDGSGVTATVNVSVVTAVKGVIIEGEKERNLIINDKEESRSTILKASISPEDASDKTISWSLVNEDDDQYVEIEPSSTDLTCKVTAKANTLPEGVQVQVKTNDGSFTYFVTIHVTTYVSEINVDENEITLTINDDGKKTKQIEYSVLPDSASDKSVKFVSNDENIATVDETGLVTAISNGETTIDISAQDGSGVTATVNVSVVTAVKGVTIDGEKERNLIINDKEESRSTILKALISPEDASDKTISWSLVNENDNQYVEIEPSSTDLTCKVTAKANTLPDGVQVQVKTNDGSFIDIATIHVTTLVKEINVNETNIVLIKNGGESKKITYSVLPTDASNQSVDFSSSDVAVVDVGTDGTLIPKDLGEATIKLKAKDGSGVEATVKVTVINSVETVTLNYTSYSLVTNKDGENYFRLETIYTPDDATIQNVSWSVESGSEFITISPKGFPHQLSCDVYAKSGVNGKAVVLINVDGKIATCDIDVKTVPESIKFDVESITFETTHGQKEATTIATISPDTAYDTRVDYSIEEGGDKLISIQKIAGGKLYVTLNEGVTKGKTSIIATSSVDSSITTSIPVDIGTIPTAMKLEADKTILINNVDSENTATLTCSFTPDDTTFDEVRWEIVDGKDLATFEGGDPTQYKVQKLVALRDRDAGLVKVRATSAYDKSLFQEISFTISVEVKSIMIKSDCPVIIKGEEGYEKITLRAETSPKTSKLHDLVWSISENPDLINIEVDPNDSYICYVTMKSGDFGDAVVKVTSNNIAISATINVGVKEKLTSAVFESGIQNYVLVTNIKGRDSVNVYDYLTLNSKNACYKSIEWTYSTKYDIPVWIVDGVAVAVVNGDTDAIATFTNYDGSTLTATIKKMKVTTAIESIYFEKDYVELVSVDGKKVEGTFDYSWNPYRCHVQTHHWEYDDETKVNAYLTDKVHVIAYENCVNQTCTLVAVDGLGNVVKASFKVTLLTAAQGIEISSDYDYIESNTEHNSAELKITYNPKETTYKEVTWEIIEGSDIAYFDESITPTGYNVLTAYENKAGKVVVQATYKVPGTDVVFTDTIEINVGIAVKSLVLDKSEETLNLADNQELQLTATIDPSNATDTKILWSSSKPNIARVDENGKVKAIYPGTCTIYAVANDTNYGKSIIAECIIHVDAIVYFDANGGLCDTKYKVIPYGSSLGSLPEVSCFEKCFIGWFKTSETDYRHSYDPTLPVTSIIDLKAQYIYIECTSTLNLAPLNDSHSSEVYLELDIHALSLGRQIIYDESLFAREGTYGFTYKYLGDGSKLGFDTTFSIIVVVDDMEYSFTKIIHVVNNNFVFTYDEATDSYTVSGNNKDIKILLIPSTYEDKPVTTIGQSAFLNYTSISRLDFSSNNNVTKICDYAFNNVKILANIRMPKEVTYIGNYAFTNCHELRTLVFESDSTITEIGEGAFASCKYLPRISLPNSIERIGPKAFYDCPNLKRVYFNDISRSWTIYVADTLEPVKKDLFLTDDQIANGTVIRENSIHGFFRNIMVESMTFKDAIVHIPTHKDVQLEVIATPENATYAHDFFYASSDETIATVNEKGVVTTLKAGNVTITATSVDGGQKTATCEVVVQATVHFNARGGIVEGDSEIIVDPDSKITNPPTASFGNKTWLGWYVTETGGSRFDFNTTPITDDLILYAQWLYIDADSSILDTVNTTKAGEAKISVTPHSDDHAYSYQIDSSVISQIDDQHFSYVGDYSRMNVTTNITLMVVIDNVAYHFDFAATIDNSAIYAKESFKTIVLYSKKDYKNTLTKIIIPSYYGFNDGDKAIDSIGIGVFSEFVLEDVTFANNCQIKEISRTAFSGVTGLKTFTLPSSITYIGDHAFSDCTSLMTFDHSNAIGLTCIPSSCFEACEKLTSFKISNNITSIEKHAFGRSGLTSLSFDDVSASWTIHHSIEAENVTDYFFSSNDAAANAKFIKDNSSYNFTRNIMVTSLSFDKTLIKSPDDMYDTLLTIVTPDNATYKDKFIWVSSDTNVVTVDDTGFYKLIHPGLATITATTIDGSNITARCDVHVQARVTYVLNNGEENVVEIIDYDSLARDFTPTKANSIFVGWFTTDGFTDLYNFGTHVRENITLYAAYLTVVATDTKLDTFNALNTDQVGAQTLTISSEIKNNVTYSSDSDNHALVVTEYDSTTDPEHIFVKYSGDFKKLGDSVGVHVYLTFKGVNYQFDLTFDIINSGLTYVDNGGLIAISGAESARGKLINLCVPSFYQGKEVIAIDNNGFKEFSTLEEIDFSTNDNHLTVIGSYGFSKTGIREYTANDKLQVIRAYAFDGCTKLLNFSYGNGNLIESIESGTFMNTGISSLNIPSSIKTINDNAFYGSKLYSLNIANGNHISWTYALDDIDQVIYMPSDNTQTASTFMAHYSKVWIRNIMVQNITLKNPEKQIHIDDNTYQCEVSNYNPENATHKKVTWESLDTSVATIDANTGLLTFVKPGRVQVRATTIDLGGVTATMEISIAAKVVFDLQGGTGIIVPQYVEVGGYASLPSATPTKENSTFIGWFVANSGGQTFDFDHTVINGNVTIYAQWLTLTADSFYLDTFNQSVNYQVTNTLKYESYGHTVTFQATGDGATRVSVSNVGVVSYLGDFKDLGIGFTITASVSIDDNNYSISINLSIENTGLTYSDYGTGYEIRGNNTNMTTLVVPFTYNGRPIMSIGVQAFYQYTGLTNLVIHNDNTNLVAINDSAFSGIGISSFVLPQNVSILGARVFLGNANMTSFSFGNNTNITSLPDGIFANSGLSSLVVPSQITKIGIRAFYQCGNLNSLQFYNSNLTWTFNLNLDGEYIYHPLDKEANANTFKNYTEGIWERNIMMESFEIAQGTSVDVKIDGSLQLTIKDITPENPTHPHVNWTSSEPTIATINNNGVVTLYKPGTVYFTAVAADLGGVTRTITVNVLAKITFDLQGGSGEAPTQYVKVDTTVTKPSNPTKDNSTFLGWFDSPTGGNLYNFATQVKGNLNLYAQYLTIADSQQLDTINTTNSASFVLAAESYGHTIKFEVAPDAPINFAYSSSNIIVTYTGTGTYQNMGELVNYNAYVEVASGNKIYLHNLYIEIINSGLSFESDGSGGYSVKQAKNSNLTTLKMPLQYKNKNITKISDNGFSGSVSLKYVEFLNGCSITYIGSGAFASSGIESMTLFSGIQKIGSDTFNSCTHLTTFSFGNFAITSIPQQMFYGCNNLKSITIPATVTSIGIAAFVNSGVENVTFAGATSTSTWEIVDSKTQEIKATVNDNVPGTNATNLKNKEYQNCTWRKKI